MFGYSIEEMFRSDKHKTEEIGAMLDLFWKMKCCLPPFILIQSGESLSRNEEKRRKIWRNGKSSSSSLMLSSSTSLSSSSSSSWYTTSPANWWARISAQRERILRRFYSDFLRGWSPTRTRSPTRSDGDDWLSQKRFSFLRARPLEDAVQIYSFFKNILLHRYQYGKRTRGF